jgi:hypothetical protein
VNIIALDCESNGLHGQTFIAAAVKVLDGIEVDAFVGRCPIAGPADPWVVDAVLPVVGDVKETYPSYGQLCRAYDRWFQDHRDVNVEVVAHIGWPVEARFLLDAHTVPFSGPYPLYDTSSLLAAAGRNPTSEREYAATEGIVLPEGREHDPLYDARVTALVYQHLRHHDGGVQRLVVLQGGDDHDIVRAAHAVASGLAVAPFYSGGEHPDDGSPVMLSVCRGVPAVSDLSCRDNQAFWRCLGERLVQIAAGGGVHAAAAQAAVARLGRRAAWERERREAMADVPEIGEASFLAELEE